MSCGRFVGCLIAMFASGLNSPAVSALEIIVDNAESGFTVVSRTWSTTSSGGYAGSYRSRANSSIGEVKWSASLPRSGTWEVAVWYVAGANRATDAPYTVQHAGGTETLTVNQQVNGGQWVTLGNWEFSTASAAEIRLRNVSSGATVVADAVRFRSIETPPPPQFRAVWADAFHAGFKSAAEIDGLVARAVAGNCNAIFAEVLAYQDNVGNGHGAYWNSSILPKAADVSGGIDPLAYLLQKAHAAGLEVHTWLVAFRVSTTWPPSGNATLAAHPEYLMVPSGALGSTATVGGYYTLDPGSPDVQNYLSSIVNELTANYPIDGIHWDYIRYTQTDAGYPADASYAGSSLARFRRITGTQSTPAAIGDAAWNDFRRRTITELIRRIGAEIRTIPNPRQPLRHTAALISWGNAPGNFTSSSAYASCFQDWRLWMEQGHLDAGCPMLYYREYDATYATYYRNWVNACLNWRYARHMYIGQANYLNPMPDSVTQMQYAYTRGANGTVNYSYWSTADADRNGTPENDWNFYPYLQANLFTQPAPLPPMPWRVGATATEGTLFGRVTNASIPVDDAVVQVGALAPVRTDANGYYVATMVPSTGAETAYDVTAGGSGQPTTTHTGITVSPGGATRLDIALGAGQPPVIVAQPMPVEVCPDAPVALQVTAVGEGSLTYLWIKEEAGGADEPAPIGSGPVLEIGAAQPSHAGTYRCVVTNANGSTSSDPVAIVVNQPVAISEHPQSVSAPFASGVTLNVTGAGGQTLTYRWYKDDAELADGTRFGGTSTSSLLIQRVEQATLGTYRCVIGGCGTVTSDAAVLTMSHGPGDFDLDGDVDQEDFGHFQACYSAEFVPQTDPACRTTLLDADSFVDFFDLAIFQRCVSGPGQPSAKTCAD